MNRAYSILNIKSVHDDERVIEGIASTPTPDRMGDIVEPMGAKFKVPMPLLWQHRSDEPVGHVEFAKPNKDGIPFKARIATIDEPGELKSMVDKAWQAVKAKLVSAVSIGFTINAHEIMKDGGWRIKEWDWLELSLVTIPANVDATITSIKSYDAQLLAASGHKQESGRTVSAGVSAPPSIVVKAQKEPIVMKKTIAEQISAFEETKKSKNSRMSEIMDAAAEKGETLDQAAKDEYDGLEAEVKEISEHIVRLRAREAMNISSAVEVKAGDVVEASRSREGVRVQVAAKKLPPGIPFTRYVIALARAKGNLMLAHEMARGNEQWRAESPEVETVLKAAVAAGTTTDTTWASPLVQYQNLTSEFIEYLRPMTIVGRIPGLRRVPFKVKIPRQTGASTVNWVGEGKVKPLSALAFDSITLDFAKIAGIIVLTDELVRHSSPAAEALVREDLARAIVQFMDVEFIDPTNASTDVSPASVTYGTTSVTATGTTAAALRDDIGTLMSLFLTNNMQMGSAVWVTSQTAALKIGLMRNSLGQPEFGDLGANGGTLAGFPVVTSEGVPYVGGSPADGSILVLMNASDILLADDGNVTIDASREASLQMDSAPDSPPTASTSLVSLFQHNMMAIRAEREVNWVKRRSTAVAYITGVKYAA